MLNVILYQPEIPPNTGNLIRLCANSGAALHLIEPLGFSMESKALRRAGLDYHEAARVRRWPSLEACWDELGVRAPAVARSDTLPDTPPATRVFAATTRASAPYTAPRYRAGDALLFGPESRGLPDEVLDDRRIAGRLRVPMLPGSRSLNLSNAVSIVLYEAWRQLGFEGAGQGRPQGPTGTFPERARSDAPSRRAGRRARRS